MKSVFPLRSKMCSAWTVIFGGNDGFSECGWVRFHVGEVLKGDRSGIDRGYSVLYYGIVRTRGQRSAEMMLLCTLFRQVCMNKYVW